MPIPAMIIGSETEYGFLITTEDGRAFSGNTDSRVALEVIHEMLNEAIHVVGGGVYAFGDTFMSLQEHREADQRSQREYRGRRRRANRDSQRRGYSGSMLVNGARFYNDLMHPEYSTPECRDPYMVMCAQKAGDTVVQTVAKRTEPFASDLLGSRATITIAKNNSDGRGNSYAGHENYLVSGDLFRALGVATPQSDITTLFFVARQIITGAGKIGGEGRHRVPYQLSQRADFFEQRFSIDTTGQRGIINLRDVPYANPGQQHRFHVIVGDSNRSDLSLFLKFGITALFFMMLDTGSLQQHFPWYGTALRRPVAALWQVSHDLTLSRELSLECGQRTTALEVMRDLQKCAERFVNTHSLDAIWHQVVALWKGTLEGLGGDRHAHPLSRSLDWVAVERVLHHHMKKTGKDFEDDTCRSLELQYRVLDADSIFAALNERGQLTTLSNEEDVRRLIHSPPHDTRAWVRAEILKRFPEQVDYLRWNTVHLRNEIICLPDPLWGGEKEAKALFSDDPSLEEFVKRVHALASKKIHGFAVSKYDHWRINP